MKNIIQAAKLPATSLGFQSTSCYVLLDPVMWEQDIVWKWLKFKARPWTSCMPLGSINSRLYLAIWVSSRFDLVNKKEQASPKGITTVDDR